jgi:two-component system OmpR family response regulator
MDCKAHILVVDDDPEICELLEDYLTHQGYEVRTVQNGESMRRALEDQPADLVVLDLMMPGEDGLSLTRYLRDKSELGIIILTGMGEEADRVVGLEMGADDYVSKPFSTRELAARVKTVLRRRMVGGPSDASTRTPIARFAGWSLDRVARRLSDPKGNEVRLTTMEFNLLNAFTLYPNRVLDRDRLLDLLRNRSWEPFDRSIDVLVGRLRSKIESDAKKPELIKTVRGSGYVLAANVELFEKNTG